MFNVHIISSSLRVYEVNFCKRQNGVSLLKAWCKTISASHSKQLKVISCFTNVLHRGKNSEFQKKRWLLCLTLWIIWSFHNSLKCAWHSDIYTIFLNERSSADTPEKEKRFEQTWGQKNKRFHLRWIWNSWTDSTAVPRPTCDRGLCRLISKVSFLIQSQRNWGVTMNRHVSKKVFSEKYSTSS